MKYEDAIKVLGELVESMDSDIKRDRERLLEKVKSADNDTLDYEDTEYFDYKRTITMKAGVEYAIDYLMNN